MRTRCSRIGTKSFELEHEIHADGRARRRGEERPRRLRLRARESVPLSDEIARGSASSGDSSIGLTSVASRSSVSWSNGAGQST